MSGIVRLAKPDDAAAIAAIYDPIVADTWISFEESAPGEIEMRRRIEATAETLPFLCNDDDGIVTGYAYASKHRERAAYRWSVDVSAYVHEAHRRKGVARSLYATLLQTLTRLGYYNAFAGITLPNVASVRFHRELGFIEIGRYRNVGYKAGGWRDTLWLERTLREPDGPPREPITMRERLR